MNGLPNFEEFLADLLGIFIKDPQKLAFIKERLSVVLTNLNTRAIRGVDRYVSNYLIPELSSLIKLNFDVSVEKQLMSLKPFVISGLEVGLKKGRVLNKNEIIEMAKRSIPELITETAFPNASEDTKCLVRNVAKFLADLLGLLIKDPQKPQKVAFIKERLSVVLINLKTRAIRGVDSYVSNYLIPELSRLAKLNFDVSVEKQLMSLKPFVIRGLEVGLKEGKVLNKNEIIELAKRSIPEVITETAIPNASENTKFLVRIVLRSIQDAVFTSRSGTTPSVEGLLRMVLEKCADKVFCIGSNQLSKTIDKLINMMPETVDGIMEFLVRHVLPALSVCFEATAFALVAVFLNECFQRLGKEGTIKMKGRDLAKPLAVKALKAASNEVMKKTTGEVSKVSSKVVTETVVKSKVTHEVVKKCVVDKAGKKVVMETTKKIAAKTSKNVATKVTQNVSAKVASTTSQETAKQSVKVTTKAVNSISGKAVESVGGKATEVAGKTVQKASIKITKNVGDGISNGVTEVTKNTAKKTVKSTLTETAEGLTATTTTKVTKTSVSKTTHISQTSSKAAAEVGMKNAAKAGVTAAGISAVVGGVFLYRDLKDLDKKKKEGSIKEREYKEQKAQRVGEFAGDVIGSGVVGVAVSLAALSGPAGWAAIGVGAIVSYATGKLGGQIGKALA